MFSKCWEGEGAPGDQQASQRPGRAGHGGLCPPARFAGQQETRSPAWTPSPPGSPPPPRLLPRATEPAAASPAGQSRLRARRTPRPEQEPDGSCACVPGRGAGECPSVLRLQRGGGRCLAGSLHLRSTRGRAAPSFQNSATRPAFARRAHTCSTPARRRAQAAFPRGWSRGQRPLLDKPLARGGARANARSAAPGCPALRSALLGAGWGSGCGRAGAAAPPRPAPPARSAGAAGCCCSSASAAARRLIDSPRGGGGGGVEPRGGAGDGQAAPLGGEEDGGGAAQPSPSLPFPSLPRLDLGGATPSR